MANYDISEKDEFLMLLRSIEKMMRVNPTMLLNSPDYVEKVGRFNSLVSLVPNFRLSSEESKEVQALWDSLKLCTAKRATKVEELNQLTPQERLLHLLRGVIKKWKTASYDEKKELISEVHRLQLDSSVMARMTPVQVQTYRELMETVKRLANVEQISLEEYSKLENSERKRLGL